MCNNLDPCYATRTSTYYPTVHAGPSGQETPDIAQLVPPDPRHGAPLAMRMA